MGSKTISLKDEAYEKLKALKTGDKSFSDVVMELTEDNQLNYRNFAEIDVDITTEELIEKRRKEILTDERREDLLR